MRMVTKALRRPSGSHFSYVARGVESYIFGQMLNSILTRLEGPIRFRLRDPVLFRITGNIS